VAEQSDTLVFVPAWNEEENLPAVLEELQHELPGADVLVVDDGSTDGTVSVAVEHGAEVLSFGANRGLPAAISGGYGYAVDHEYEDGSTRTGSIRPTSSGGCSSACAPTRATSPWDRGTRAATDSRLGGTRRPGRGALARRSCAAR
jgi:hypothetical protein